MVSHQQVVLGDGESVVLADAELQGEAVRAVPGEDEAVVNELV